MELSNIPVYVYIIGGLVIIDLLKSGFFATKDWVQKEMAVNTTIILDKVAEKYATKENTENIENKLDNLIKKMDKVYDIVLGWKNGN